MPSLGFQEKKKTKLGRVTRIRDKKKLLVSPNVLSPGPRETALLPHKQNLLNRRIHHSILSFKQNGKNYRKETSVHPQKLYTHKK